MTKYYPTEFSVGILEEYLSVNLYAFLINDPGNTIQEGSAMSAAAALELLSGNGYSRKGPITLPAATTATENAIVLIGATPTVVQLPVATIVAPEQDWTAAGGNIGPFTKVCYVRGGSGTIGNSTGRLARVETVTGAPLTLLDTQSYRHTATWKQTGRIS